ANNTRALKNSPDSGTRLGYLLIAELARMHGATVSINSEPGQGTEVAIVIAKSPNKDDDQQ
ncbi:MAG TPA: ATP-binding protein, partial [Flavihumibacter sp.]|nr:ATP-binding protein [Flavihumibacter sp.]